ncbi:hypothetical protein E3N88_19127 [Mikania micrantha]|uniref:Uncharacterized protein n=1 Tax=Mikania micrantha TaxID=192012 RepID=A0A5N6NMB9_9ASTR|nr:hypothetical protein E3N88_19127 [Mikania micrantha]
MFKIRSDPREWFVDFDPPIANGGGVAADYGGCVAVGAAAGYGGGGVAAGYGGDVAAGSSGTYSVAVGTGEDMGVFFLLFSIVEEGILDLLHPS